MTLRQPVSQKENDTEYLVKYNFVNNADVVVKLEL